MSVLVMLLFVTLLLPWIFPLGVSIFLLVFLVLFTRMMVTSVDFGRQLFFVF